MPKQKKLALQRGIITIDVYENSQSLYVNNSQESPLTYQEIIGALEICRTNMILSKAKLAKKKAAKSLKKQSRRHS